LGFILNEEKNNQYLPMQELDSINCKHATLKQFGDQFIRKKKNTHHGSFYSEGIFKTKGNLRF